MIVFNKTEYYRFVTRPYASSWPRNPESQDWRAFNIKWKKKPKEYPALITVRDHGDFNFIYDRDVIEGARI